MSNAIYSINKGINRPLEFRGLKAQYIWYLAGGLVGVLMLFSILYIIGFNAYLTIFIGFTLGGLVFFYVYRMNDRYGQWGWMQRTAQKKVPKRLISRSRKLFIQR